MAKYKVCYSGFAYIEADSEEEAIEIYDDDDYGIIYEEKQVDKVEEIDYFVIHF